MGDLKIVHVTYSWATDNLFVHEQYMIYWMKLNIAPYNFYLQTTFTFMS